jgi:hypothetical protein
MMMQLTTIKGMNISERLPEIVHEGMHEQINDGDERGYQGYEHGNPYLARHAFPYGRDRNVRHGENHRGCKTHAEAVDRVGGHG